MAKGMPKAIATVSYTHLDVYKRQCKPRDSSRPGWRVVQGGDGWVGPESLTGMPLAGSLLETKAALGLRLPGVGGMLWEICIVCRGTAKR